MADLSLPRETGSEKSELECPICGGLVPAVTSAYGSTSPGACPVCWPAAAPTQLQAQQAAANELKGDALAAALDDAGLPKTGTADEKRASLVEDLATPAPESAVPPA
jgi:hypothetical protein